MLVDTVLSNSARYSAKSKRKINSLATLLRFSELQETYLNPQCPIHSFVVINACLWPKKYTGVSCDGENSKRKFSE